VDKLAKIGVTVSAASVPNVLRRQHQHLAPPLEQLAIAVFEEQVVDDLLDELSRLGSLVGRASLDLATLGLKGRSRMSQPFEPCRSESYFPRSLAVSTKMAGTRPIGLRRRRTELLGQMLGRKWHMVAVIQITRQHVWKRPPTRHEWGAPTGAESCSSVRSMRTVEVLCRSPQALERCLHVRHEVSSAILDAHEVSVRNAVVPGHVAEHLE
jgi:hypothetical protein